MLMIKTLVSVYPGVRVTGVNSTGIEMINVVALHEAISAAVPEREAIVFRDRRISYRELTERTRRLANFLLSNGITARKERSELKNWQSGQDQVALYMYNGNEYPESILGALKARAVPINLNYRYVEQELLYVMRDAEVKAVVYHGCFSAQVAAVRSQIPSLKVLIQVDDGSGMELLPGAIDYETALKQSSPLKPDVQWNADDLYMIYTGGTTGMPKGVLWRQGDFAVSMLGLKDKAGTPITDMQYIVKRAVESKPLSSLSSAPYMHGTGQLVSFIAWLYGNTVVLLNNVKHLDPVDLLKTAERERVRKLSIVGDAFARVVIDELEKNDYDLSALHLIVSSGIKFSNSLKQKLIDKLPAISIYDTFASTETGPHGLSVTSKSKQTKEAHFTFDDGGKALNASKTGFARPEDSRHGWFAATGYIPLGYLNDEAKTRQTFPVIKGTRYSIPGDRVLVNKEGAMEFLGRDSSTINSGGEKIFAEEVESALKCHEHVEDVIVSSRPSERFGNEVVAIVQVKERKLRSCEQMNDEASKHIARYKLPKAYGFVDKIKRSESGKIDPKWVRQQVEKLG